MTFDDIEAAFLDQRRHEPALRSAWRRAFALVCDGLPGDERSVLQQAGEAIAGAIDAWALDHAEPPYHNRHHAAEVTFAMGQLCRVAQQAGLVSARQAALGVLAMVGHDMYHDGSNPGGGVLEARSVAAMRPIMAAAGLDAPSLDAVADVIMATAPEEVAGNAARLRGDAPRGSMGPGQDALRAMANEADVFASFLPRLGPLLSRLLACEWTVPGTPATHPVGTAAGRLAFLGAYPGFSPAALSLGLGQARQRCTDAYAMAGAISGAAATPEAGCEALDRLAPEAAARAYDAALDALAR